MGPAIFGEATASFGTLTTLVPMRVNEVKIPDLLEKIKESLLVWFVFLAFCFTQTEGIGWLKLD